MSTSRGSSIPPNKRIKQRCAFRFRILNLEVKLFVDYFVRKASRLSGLGAIAEPNMNSQVKKIVSEDEKCTIKFEQIDWARRLKEMTWKIVVKIPPCKFPMQLAALFLAKLLEFLRSKMRYFSIN